MSLIEKVAGALCELRNSEERALGLGPVNPGRVLPLDRRAAAVAVRVTLEAIREPTEAMLESGMRSSDLRCADVWRAMIDSLRRELGGRDD